MMERLSDYEIVGGHVHAIPLGNIDEAIMRLAAYEDSGLTPAEIKSLYAEWDVMMSVLNSIGGGYTRLRELAEAARDGRVIITDTTDTDIAHDGLKLKYRVYKAENNAPVENCFVLRPMKDRAARIAMEAYAKATENKELFEDSGV